MPGGKKDPPKCQISNAPCGVLLSARRVFLPHSWKWYAKEGDFWAAAFIQPSPAMSPGTLVGWLGLGSPDVEIWPRKAREFLPSQLESKRVCLKMGDTPNWSGVPSKPFLNKNYPPKNQHSYGKFRNGSVVATEPTQKPTKNVLSARIVFWLPSSPSPRAEHPSDTTPALLGPQHWLPRTPPEQRLRESAKRTGKTSFGSFLVCTLKEKLI